jgi:hypothetical protein
MRVYVKTFLIRYEITDITKSNQIFQTREKINERSAKSQTLSYLGLATLI